MYKSKPFLFSNNRYSRDRGGIRSHVYSIFSREHDHLCHPVTLPLEAVKNECHFEYLRML